MEIENEEQTMRASELVKQFKLDMMKDSPAGSGKAELSLESDDSDSSEAGAKTIGRRKTKS